MKASLVIVSVVAVLAWVALLYVSAHAVASMGFDAAGTYFFGDFDQPWRAQFNTDFAIHLLGIAMWMIWRSRSLPLGVLCAILAVNFGALFTIPFVIAAIWKADGNVPAALSGAQYKGDPSFRQ